ncbi:Uncharacterised protein [Segatella copri]|nr:Uncharacterised protein [Segatella copri]
MRENSLFTTRNVKKWRSHRYLIGAKAYLPPLPSAMWTSPSRSYIITMSCKRATTNYMETIYSGISTLTDSYHLRPRELMISAQYSF